MQTFAVKSRAAPAFTQATPNHARVPRPAPGVRRILQSSRVQAKLRIGSVDDPAEREADRVADQVMSMPEAAAASAAAGTVQRLCADCEDELHRKERAVSARGGGAASSAMETPIGSLAAGAPLPASERAFFEPRFGRGFADVRIHTGATADRAAGSINARAFTLHSDIAFAAGEFRPGSSDGRRLLAHELAHVVQQSTENAALIQRDVALPPHGVPNAPVVLTPQQVQAAIAFNQARFSDPYSVRVIRDVVGLEPVPAVVDEELVRAIAEWQAEQHLPQDGKIGHETTRSFFLELVAEKEFRDAITLAMDSYAIEPGLNLQNIEVGLGAHCCLGGADAVTRDVGAGPARVICFCRTSIPTGAGGYDHFVRIVLHEAVHVPQRAAGPADHDAREFDAFFAETCVGGRAPQLTPAQRVGHANIALGHFNAMPAAFRTAVRTAQRAQLLALIAAGGQGPC
jgi:uncharacterized protein DUF4157